MTAYDHPDWAALLAAVGDCPDDDLPRLAAADWLDEHGDPQRAEFIRVQCAIAAGDERSGLAWRGRALLAHPFYGGQWAAEASPGLVRLDFEGGGSPLRAVAVRGAERVAFRRGFPWAVACPAVEWRRHGGRAVPRQPVRELTLTGCDEVPLADWWDALETLRRLDAVSIDASRPLLADWLRDRLAGVTIRTPPPAPTRDVARRTPPAPRRPTEQERRDQGVEDEMERRRRLDPIPW